MSDKPMIAAFLDAYNKFIAENSNDSDIEDNFINPYIENYIDSTEKKQNIIKEYGVKKLIDKMIADVGEECCEDILEPINDPKSMWTTWILLMLSDVSGCNK